MHLMKVCVVRSSACCVVISLLQGRVLFGGSSKIATYGESHPQH